MPRYLGILLLLLLLIVTALARAEPRPLDPKIPAVGSSAGCAWHAAAEEITLAGKPYQSYAYLKDGKDNHAPGWITFDATGWHRFTAAVGRSDRWAQNDGPLTIEVDGEKTHAIKKQSGETPHDVDLSLAGAKTLTRRFASSILLAAPTVLRAEQVNPKDGAALVWVPAEEFVMGSKDNEGSSNERPQRKVYLDGYWLYKYEVTVAQYRAFCAATGRALPPFPSGYSWKGKNG